MATYYCDPDASGADDGSSKTDAWSTFQRAIDGTDGTKPGAGDIVEMRHGTGADETVSTTIDVDGTTGGLTTGFVTFRGVNSSWVNDGTRYDLDANSNNINILTLGTPDYIKLENIYLHDTGTGDGISCAGYNGCSGWVFVNLKIDGCVMGVEGNTGGLQAAIFSHCQITNNSSNGIELHSGVIDKCYIDGNGGVGITYSGATRGLIITDTVVINSTWYWHTG